MLVKAIEYRMMNSRNIRQANGDPFVLMDSAWIREDGTRCLISDWQCTSKETMLSGLAIDLHDTFQHMTQQLRIHHPGGDPMKEWENFIERIFSPYNTRVYKLDLEQGTTLNFGWDDGLMEHDCIEIGILSLKGVEYLGCEGLDVVPPGYMPRSNLDLLDLANDICSF
jgi:hypothetical protein